MSACPIIDHSISASEITQKNDPSHNLCVPMTFTYVILLNLAFFCKKYMHRLVLCTDNFFKTFLLSEHWVIDSNSVQRGANICSVRSLGNAPKFGHRCFFKKKCTSDRKSSVLMILTNSTKFHTWFKLF